jgi:hypothetical protein
MTFFIDGKKDSAIPLKKGTLQLRGSKVVLGVSVPGGPGGIERYRGLLGSVLIYSRALSEMEIRRLHAATARKLRWRHPVSLARAVPDPLYLPPLRSYGGFTLRAF